VRADSTVARHFTSSVFDAGNRRANWGAPCALVRQAFPQATSIVSRRSARPTERTVCGVQAVHGGNVASRQGGSFATVSSWSKTRIPYRERAFSDHHDQLVLRRDKGRPRNTRGSGFFCQMQSRAKP